MIENTIYTINRLQLILSYPSIVVPSLSDTEIRRSLLEAMLGYLEGEVPFDILLSVADTIATFQGMRANTTEHQFIEDTVRKISGLSSIYISETSREHINDVVIDAIDVLLMHQKTNFTNQQL